jgi:membrane fusion protein, multidrug efflux system
VGRRVEAFPEKEPIGARCGATGRARGLAAQLSPEESFMTSSSLRLAAAAASALLLAACGQAASENPSAQRAPPEVTVIKAVSETVPLTQQIVGRLAAIRTAQVRARVPGIILKQVYTEGTDVKGGQVLFQIDPAQLEATLHAQQAALAKAKADAANAALTSKRYQELHAKHLLSQQDLDTAIANERTTQAAVQQAEANVETAKLNLSYATVTAPIAGRASEALVDEGALVGQGEATPLTTIDQIDPIYVNFSLSERELEELQRAAAENRTAPVPTGKNKVEVELPDGRQYAQAGTLDFSGISVDPETGAVAMRAVLPNPDHRLLPGMFVKLRITLGQVQHAFVLPQAAVSRDQEGAYVLVVGKDDKVEQRRVDTVQMTRTDWVLTGPLADGDRVIVSGLQKVHPGMKANPQTKSGSASAPGKH